MPTIADTELVHMDDGTFMWVEVSTIADAALPAGDAAAIATIMTWPWFDYDGIGDRATARRRGVHAAWHLSALLPANYQRVSTADAVDRLHTWATRFGPDAESQSPAALALLAERVHPILRTGEVHLLNAPVEDRDDYCVIGDNSDIVDLIVTDRINDRVYLILATDD